MRENCRGGCTVTGNVVGLGGSLLEELGAHILKRIFEFNFLGNGNAIMCNGWGTEFTIHCHVAAFRTERRTD